MNNARILYQRPRIVQRERLEALLMADSVISSAQDT
jgi:hypothetical protein